jgi:Zn-dependent peptidase ImmA (M78 family)/DNA-binding Xre family transcriptional regulator
VIKNQKQYAHAKAQAEKFRAASLSVVDLPCPEGTHPKIWAAYKAGLDSQLETLEREIDEYEVLRSGAVQTIEVDSLEDLPRGLIKARIAKGWTHQQLADQVDVKSQQIQRWESQDYDAVSFNRLVEIAEALEVQVCESISFRKAAKHGMDALKDLGIEKSLLQRRIAPDAGTADHDIISASLHMLKRIWGIVISPNGALDMQTLSFSAAQTARFKLPSNSDSKKVGAYAQYAYFIAKSVADHLGSPVRPIPRGWRDLRHELFPEGTVSLRAALEKVWDLGIPVIPLSDPVRFHGACWRLNGRNVIVLKQSARGPSRWLFDLLHELHHASEPESASFAQSTLEATDKTRRESSDEIAAHQFAGRVLLDGRAEELFTDVVRAAQSKAAHLKQATKSIAQQQNVNLGILANYIAFRLYAEGIDWWGTAANLQDESEDAFQTVAAVFRKRFDTSRLSPEDSLIVETAISDPSLAKA